MLHRQSQSKPEKPAAKTREELQAEFDRVMREEFGSLDIAEELQRLKKETGGASLLTRK